MSTPLSIRDQVYYDVVNSVLQQRDAAVRSKTSSAPAAPKQKTEIEKLSTVKARNEDLVRLGTMLSNLGDLRFERVAMAKMSAANGEEFEAPSRETSAPSQSAHGRQVADNASVGAPDETGDQSSGQPTITSLQRGEGTPDRLSDKANKSVTDSPPTGADGRTHAAAMGASGKNLSDGSENVNLEQTWEDASKMSAAQMLQRLTRGKFVKNSSVAQQRRYLQSLGIHSSEQALQVLVKGSSRAGKSVQSFFRGLDLASRDKAQVMRDLSLEHPDSPYFGKRSESLQSDIATAGKAVEDVIKATGALPEAQEIAEAANVHPLAANIAIYEKAELIAATGGQVGSASAPAGAAPVPEAAGAPVPPAGAVAGAPMAPAGAPAGAAPAGAPPMMAAPMPPMGAAPPGGGMVATASAHNNQKIAQRLAALRSIIPSVVEKASKDNTIVTDREESVAGSGVAHPSDNPVDPGPSASTTPTDTNEMLSSEESAIVDSVLGSNSANANSDPSDVAKFKDEDNDARLETPVSNPQDKDHLSTNEPVRSNREGNLAPSSMQTGEAQSRPDNVDNRMPQGEASKSVQSEAKSKDDYGMNGEMSEEDKTDHDAEEDTSDGDKGDAEKELDKRSQNLRSRMNLALSELFPTKESRNADAGHGSSVHYADGGGANATVGTASGDAFTSYSDDTSQIKRAVEWVRDYTKKHSKSPTVQDVISEAGVTHDEAKLALARGTENDISGG